jgi:hypothetical protein
MWSGFASPVSSIREAERKPISQPLRPELVQTFDDNIVFLAERIGGDDFSWKMV